MTAGWYYVFSKRLPRHKKRVDRALQTRFSIQESSTQAFHQPD